MWSAALLLSLLPLAFAEDFRILHRIHNPLGPPSPFFERGKLSLTSSASSLVASDNLGDDLLQFAETAQTLKGALYQVALKREGDEHEGQWSVSSVKACYLPKSTSETFIVHQTSDNKPFALDYFISPIPHDGSCPKRQTGSSPYELRQTSNTTLSISSPRLPPLYDDIIVCHFLETDC
ncbi:hypothetical protein PILCRDRAFT_155953 [Piloderma croceum F 1598]|uniref:ER membrane protein complex subunit 10 n=1 Tax=Piloderma croceum (strain F 1598) TaxID=765440 RepID=A0A0C3CMN5_PILCF|nr:hypothetical protein PILCRDRAFT_155953 [Piloderma croceum F 1598]